MGIDLKVQQSFDAHGWFKEPGAYVLVDGQFGSTGKGLMAGVIAQIAGGRVNKITTNAGPNSGHTAYYEGQQIMTQQLPVASVFLEKMGHKPLTILNGGAVIDEQILLDEVTKFEMDHRRVLVHPQAALISQKDRDDDQKIRGSIAGTGKGIGPAIARKVGREYDAIAKHVFMPILPNGYPEYLGWDRMWDWQTDRVFVETAQGFSLGLNSQFYPYVTSRETTVMQAIADARIPAQAVRKVIMCCRTYPIRVGNVETAHSGDCYYDQREIEWGDIGFEPELTTVTKRKRRLFTWSRRQFRDAVAANQPDVIFLNFFQYLGPQQVGVFCKRLVEDYHDVMGRRPDFVLLGTGPNSEDVSVMFPGAKAAE